MLKNKTHSLELHLERRLRQEISFWGRKNHAPWEGKRNQRCFCGMGFVLGRLQAEADPGMTNKLYLILSTSRLCETSGEQEEQAGHYLKNKCTPKPGWKAAGGRVESNATLTPGIWPALRAGIHLYQTLPRLHLSPLLFVQNSK